MSESEDRCRERHRKRVITDARKEQNRAAARVYRQRQKDGRQNFQPRNQRRREAHQILRPKQPRIQEANVTANYTQYTFDPKIAHTQNSSALCIDNGVPETGLMSYSTRSSHTFQRPQIFHGECLSFGESPLLLPDAESFISTTDPSHPLLIPNSLDVPLRDDSSLTMFDFWNLEMNLNDTASIQPHQGQAKEPSMLSPLQPSHALQMSTFHEPTSHFSFQPPLSDVSEIPNQLMDNSVEKDWAGHVSGESSLITGCPIDARPLEFSKPPISDLHLNYIQFSSVATFSACLRNALSLGIKLQDLMTSKYCSPFYRPTTPGDDPQVLLAAAHVPSVPAHLQPTLPQILFPHHAYLDLLPFPMLRARAIALAATSPRFFSHMDVKLDVIEGGLICWGARDGKGKGDGQPWDMRSWEVAPWFLKKWKMLIDGEEGEIWKQSARWQKVRDMTCNTIPTVTQSSSLNPCG